MFVYELSDSGFESSCSHLICFYVVDSVGIKEKSESQNGCFKKAKYAKFSEKQTFLTLWYANVSDILSKDADHLPDALFFLEKPVLRFALFFLINDSSLPLQEVDMKNSSLLQIVRVEFQDFLFKYSQYFTAK